MPFGKYRGQELAQVPDDYLLWLLAEGDPAPTLRLAAKRELDRRDATAGANGAGPATGSVRAVVREWFHRQELRHHPDRGVSREAMAALNVAREEL
jgi:hypothetical protein